MKKAEDLSGRKFGRWTVLRLHHIKTDKNNKRISYWLCQCECGNRKVVNVTHLKNGTSLSCGCYAKEMSQKRQTTHGLSKTRIYKIWMNIKKRCYNEKTIRFENYGGRGIKVCQEWLDDFINFYNWAINNGYQENLSIDRIDVNGNYEPSNCKWSNAKSQARNRRNNHFITYNGETHCIAEWSDITGIKRDVIDNRIRKNWDIERILTTPVKKQKLEKLQKLKNFALI